MPKVLNLHHSRIPPGAVYIGRPMRFHSPEVVRLGSKWSNKFKIGRDGTREEVIAKYERWLLDNPKLLAEIGELRGCDLACWCAPEPCHGDVLQRLANAEK